MRKRNERCTPCGKNSVAVSEDLRGVKIGTLEIRQNIGKSGIARRQFLRDFTAQGIGAACPSPVSVFREQIAEPQTIQGLREPYPGFLRVCGCQVRVNIRSYLPMVNGIAEVAVILQKTCDVVVGASQ